MGLAVGSITNLVYYASVSKGTMIVAEHRADSMDLTLVAAQCLEKVPAFHSRFTYTNKRKIFSCIIEEPFTYCAIVDEALTKYKAFALLEDVRDEFNMMMHDQGMQQDGQGLEPYCLTDRFSTVFRRLIAPFVGVPQKEVDRIEEEEFLAQQNGEYEDDTYIHSGQPEVSISDHNVNHNNHNHNHKRAEHERALEKNTERRFRFSPLRGKGGKADKKKVKDQVRKLCTVEGSISKTIQLVILKERVVPSIRQKEDSGLLNVFSGVILVMRD
jgi:hypothetical protein